MRIRPPCIVSPCCLMLVLTVASSATALAEDEVSPVTPLMPSEPSADPVPIDPRNTDGPRQPTPPSPARRRTRDRLLVNPYVTTPSARAFCDAGALPRPNREPRVEGDKWARLVYDEGCSRHELSCIKGGIDKKRAPPIGCLETAVYDGETRLDDDNLSSSLQCAKCPEGYGTDGSFATCSETQIGWAKDPELVLFDVRTKDREYWEQTGTAALATYTSERSSIDAKKQAALQLLDLVRDMADALFYCRNVHPYLPSPPEEHPEAAYEFGRVDLNKWMVWGGLTEEQGTGMEISVLDDTFHVYSAALRGPTASGTGFSVDTIILELVHEMRHMATFRHGAGEPGQPEIVKDAEHRINEQEDYAMMFRHPYFRTIEGNVSERIKADFLAGRDAELTCLASIWPVDEQKRGYPPDTTAAPSRATMPGMGMMGLGIPLGMGVTKGKGSVVSPMTPVTERPARCFQGGALTADQRCHVAAWAKANPVMRSFMVRTLGITEYPQPWNTLAHWSLLLPFRSRAACDASGHYVGRGAQGAGH